MKNLKNQNCLITGAASGIGRSLAIGLAKEGMNLFIVDIDTENLEKVKKEIEKFGVKVFAGKCDVSKYEDFENIAKEVHSKLGDIDLLINNAGIVSHGFVENLELEEDWKKVIDVNLWGTIYPIKVFLPGMLERGSGHIVNVSSTAGVIGLPFHPHYVASKFAVVGITEALYSELSHRGLDFSVICPGLIKTDIYNRATPKFNQSIQTENQNEIDKKLEDFEHWRDFLKDASTPDEAAKKYIKGIKKNKLYIFDNRIIPVGMYIKGISEKLYKIILRKLGESGLNMIETALSESGISGKDN